MRAEGGQGQRRPYNRRDEPVTALVSLNPKQRERQVPKFRHYEDMPMLEEGPKKELSVTNKFSSLMDEDDENTSHTENKGIEEPAGTPVQKNGKLQQSFRQKNLFSNQPLLGKRGAQRPPEVPSSRSIPTIWV